MIFEFFGQHNTENFIKGGEYKGKWKVEREGRTISTESLQIETETLLENPNTLSHIVVILGRRKKYTRPVSS